MSVSLIPDTPEVTRLASGSGVEPPAGGVSRLPVRGTLLLAAAEDREMLLAWSAPAAKEKELYEGEEKVEGSLPPLPR